MAETGPNYYILSLISMKTYFRPTHNPQKATVRRTFPVPRFDIIRICSNQRETRKKYIYMQLWFDFIDFD